METRSLIPAENIKNEPDFEDAEKAETNSPIFLGKLKQELDDDEADQVQGCSQDSSPLVQAADKKDRQVPGKKKAEKSDVCGEYGEIYSCVQGYLPNSKVEYLQVMPDDRYLGLDKQDNLLDGLSQCNRSNVSRQGDGTSVTDMSEGGREDDGTSVTDMSGGSNTKLGLRKKKTSEDSIGHKVMIADDKKIHNIGRPFTCDVCGVGFSWRSHLNRHKRIHTGEKPYKCDVCGVRFNQCEHLKDHKRMHTGEKPFRCDMCGVGFTSCTSLKHHKRIHTGEKPYKCDVCGVQFAQNSNLTMHKRTHTGEKPYRCDVCNIGFSRCEHLKKHKRVHTGEKPYKCDVCGVDFALCTSLKSHK